MSLQRTILVPSDFSKNALVAARYALGFALQSGYKLHFIFAYQPFKSAFQTMADNEAERKEAQLDSEERMEAFREALGDTGEVSTCYGVAQGHLVKCLEDFIRKEPVAFIVMGTHGESGPRKDIMGSNTYDVAISLSIPLVIVPETASGFNLDHVLFFTDFQQADVHTLEAFKDIVGESHRQVTLVHIVEDISEEKAREAQLHEWKDRLQRETGNAALDTELVSGDENLYIINHIIERLHGDLTLLTLKREKRFLDRLFYKSLAKAIVLNPKVPVLLTSVR